MSVEESKPEAAVPRRRRRLTLSLRAMMLLVLVAGGVLGWKARRASIQRRAVATITEVGGSVIYDYQVAAGKATGRMFVPGASPWAPAWLRGPIGDEYFQEPVMIFLEDSSPPGGHQANDRTFDAITTLDSVEDLNTLRVPIGDASFTGLIAMPRLKSVCLLDIDVTDAGLATLNSSPALETLRLRVKPGAITRRGLESIARQPRIKFLELLLSSFKDPSDLAPLAKMTQLEYLRIYKSPEDDASLEHIRNLTALKTIDLRTTRLTDAGVERLSGVRSLETLLIDESKLTDVGFARLATDHPGLKGLYFDPAPVPSITDVGLSALVKLPSMTDLMLNGSNLTDAGLDHLKGMKLDSLSVSGLGITDAGLAGLGTSNQFRDLSLSATGISGQGLSWLSAQAKLRMLALDRSKVDDAGMANLATAPALEILILTQTSLTDLGLATLQQQALRLNYLDVRGTRVTEKGLAAFRKARPQVEIQSGPVEEIIPR